MEAQQPNNLANAPIGPVMLPRQFMDSLASYVSFNELKRLRLVSKDFNDSLKNHPRILNSTLLMGKKFPEKFAEMRRISGSDEITPWRNVRCSLRRLERCEFVRNFWKTRMINHVRKLEMVNVGHKCHVITHFIGVLPVLQELTLDDVSFRSRNVMDMNPPAGQMGNRQIAIFCEHNGAGVVFGYPDIRRDQTIRKVTMRKIPIIPTCLLQFLTVRTAGVLEEFHYIDNVLPRGANRNYRPTVQTQERHVKNMIRINMVTLRKLSWINNPEFEDFIRSMSNDRQEFPALNFVELNIGQEEQVHPRSLVHIRDLLAVQLLPLSLTKLELDLFQRLRSDDLQRLHQSVLLCRALEFFTLTVHNFVPDDGDADYEIQPGLNTIMNLRGVEIRYKSTRRRGSRVSVRDILDNSQLPRQLETLVFCGLHGLNHNAISRYLNSLDGVQPLTKLIISEKEKDAEDYLTDRNVQEILEKFPLLEELTLTNNNNISDAAFTGIPEKTVKLIYQSQSYTVLARGELNLPETKRNLSSLKRLKKLNLASLNIGDVTLFRAMELPCLRELDMSYTIVSDVGLLQLPLKAPAVEKLTINCCQNVSTLGVCLLLKKTQIQCLTTTQTVLERDHPGLKYSFPAEAAERSAKIFVEHNPRERYHM